MYDFDYTIKYCGEIDRTIFIMDLFDDGDIVASFCHSDFGDTTKSKDDKFKDYMYNMAEANIMK